jgi:chemotaxis protein MotB
MMMKKLGFRAVPLAMALMFGAGSLVGCGHTDEEMAAKQREIDSLQANLKAAKALHDQDEQKFNESQRNQEELRAKLKDAGLGLEKSEAEKAKLRQAMAEYETRLHQLEEMKTRFRDLKTRLDKLTSVGLKVAVRHNRMVIQLPGDILFDSGADTLKADGKKVLKQVADVINQDQTLRTRDFQIAGHTDNADYGGPFRDNWGLSLMRARQVLVFLVAPDGKGAGGGGLDPKHWSASGYGITDPVAGTVEKQTAEEKQKNRRVELVLEPNVEEMLNLKDL